MVQRIERPELFFGIVAPVGVDLDMIIEVLSSELGRQKYASSLVHVTSLMREVPSKIEIRDEPYLDRIRTRIAYADDVCERLKSADALAAITVGAIRSEREKQNREHCGHSISDEEAEAPLEGHAFIIRQFKRPDEIKLMRQVYGKLFSNLGLRLSRRSRGAFEEED